MFKTPTITTRQNNKDLTSPLMEKNFKVTIKLKELVVAIIFLFLIYFEVSAINNFVWSGGFDYAVSSMLFKITMYILGFVLMLYLIVLLFFKEVTDDWKRTGKDIQNIKEAAYDFEKKMERLDYLDKTIIKERIKQFLSDNLDQTCK